MQVVLDNEVISYDHARYPFVDWVKARIAEAGYDGSDLTRLHEVVPLAEVDALQKRIIRATGEPEYREMARTFAREVLEPIHGAELALQRYVNLRIFLPDRPDMCIHFHNGLWYGHGTGETTCWMPMCQTGGTGSLQVIDLATSRELSTQALEERWDHAQMQEEFLARASAVEMGPGQALLFQQEMLHGNAPSNETGKTRVSFDMRIAVKGGALARKMVGGYFEPVACARPAPAEPVTGERHVIGYVNNNTANTQGIPIVLQRLMMKQYIEPLAMRYTYEQLEIEAMPYLPILQHVLERDRPDDVVLYSVFALPDEARYRGPLLDTALKHGVTLHFANEDLAMCTAEDRDYVESLLDFAVYEKLGALVN